MKGCLLVLAFVVVSAVGAIGLVVVLGDDGPRPTESMTQRVEAEVTRSAPDFDTRGTQHRGYAVDLRYEVDGTWYAATSWVPEDQWTPARGPVTICTDPDDPAAHVVPTRAGAACGDATVGRHGAERARVAEAP